MHQLLACQGVRVLLLICHIIIHICHIIIHICHIIIHIQSTVGASLGMPVLQPSYWQCMCIPYMYPLYVCLICMPYMFALYVCLICMPYVYGSQRCGHHSACRYCRQATGSGISWPSTPPLTASGCPLSLRPSALLLSGMSHHHTHMSHHLGAPCL